MTGNTLRVRCFVDKDDSHLSVHTRGPQENSRLERFSIGSTATKGFKLDDGKIHTATIKYSSRVLSIWVDKTLVLTVPIDLETAIELDQGRAYVGFTAATGAEFQNHDILNWEYRVGADVERAVDDKNSAPSRGPVNSQVRQSQEDTRIKQDQP